MKALEAERAEAANEDVAPRILVVDDEEPIRRSLARILERNGYRCSYAPDAEEARERLACEAFDVCFLRTWICRESPAWI